MNELHLSLFISVRCRRQRPGLGDWGRVKSVSKDRKRLPTVLSTNGFGTGRVSWYATHKPPYSFKRLVNVYKGRLNVYKIKRYANP